MDLFVVLPNVPRSSQGPPGRQLSHQACQITGLGTKAAKIQLQQYLDSAILRQWAMIGG